MTATPTNADRRPDWIDVAGLDELPPGGRLVRRVRGFDLLLLRDAETVSALENRCPHLGKPLERGRIAGGRITCPFHGACFQLADGKAVGGPTEVAVPVFPARVNSERRIEVDVSIKPRSTGGWFGAVTGGISGHGG